jgi:hypothetical protein
MSEHNFHGGSVAEGMQVRRLAARKVGNRPVYGPAHGDIVVILDFDDTAVRLGLDEDGGHSADVTHPSYSS